VLIISIQQPIALQGLQVLIKKLRLPQSHAILSQVSRRLNSFGEGKVSCNGHQKRDPHPESPNAQTDPTYPTEASTRIAELEHEIEAIRERVKELQCQMTEVMTMCNGEDFPVCDCEMLTLCSFRSEGTCLFARWKSPTQNCILLRFATFD
jgi:hypothetical protein